MSQAVMQHSFHAGEWAPALNARVDVAKYHSAAALLENFFVDYRGGASTRSGLMYVLQCYKSNFPVRLIRFQQNFLINFVLEFGQNYIRPFFNGAPVLEAANTITGISQANPAVVTVANSYNAGDWVFIAGVNGMTQVNGRYFQVNAATGANITLGDLNGNNINSTTYSAYVSGGTVQRVYTIVSPYLAADLALLKFAQTINTMVICHPNYQPSILTFVGPTNWNLSTINFGSTIASPTGVSVSTTLAAGAANYSYVVTAVDNNGQESAPSVPGTLASIQDIRSVAGTNSVHWTGSSGAASYNVYRAQVSYVAVPAGSAYGFIGNCTGTTFIDSNIAPDFTLTPPIIENPFAGAPVQSVTVTAGGTYSAIPGVTIAPPASGNQATAQALVGALSVTGILAGSFGSVGDVYSIQLYTGGGAGSGTVSGPTICNVQVTATTGGNPGTITGVSVVPGTAITVSAIPGTQFANANYTTGAAPRIGVNLNWTVTAVNIVSGGSGYTSVPAVTFSAGAATATAVLGTASSGNPSSPVFYQQRLILAGPAGNPEQFNMSQTGSYFNYNISDPVQADDAIQGVLVSNTLQNIKSMLSMSTGLIILSDQSAWLLNGGQIGSAVTPSALVANPHAYNGASDVPPIVANFDILYVQSKGSIVRDLTFNYYAQIYTGTDISILSSHLFYGYTVNEWAFAEEPFKTVWAVRNDGVLLSLTYLKEQDIVGWAHSLSTNGLFQSTCTATEARPTTDGRALTQKVDAPYFVVQRVVNGVTVKYIERMAERNFLDASGVPHAKYAWTVDSALQYNGAPITVVGGLFHLIGQTVWGLADGKTVGPLVVSAQGTVTLANAASLITLGLPYSPRLQTLRLDLGNEAMVQGKRKKITAVTVRTQESLGLSIGKNFSSVVPMKDLVVGNVGTMSNQVVTDLVTDDARTNIDPSWTVDGQYCITQPNMMPSTVLGVIPEIAVGDTPPGGR